MRVSSPCVTRRTRQDRFAVVFSTADAILLVQRDAFGVKNGGRRQFAIRRFGALPVCDDGDRPVLVDDQSAGEFVVHVVDIDGDFCRVCFVLFEESDQLFGAGRHCPEGHFLPVDGDGGLVGASYRHHVMVAQHAGGAGGFHEIMRFDLHAAFLQQTVDAHRVCGYGGGFAIDGQSHGFARAYAECERRGERQRDHACRHSNTPKRHESPGGPPSCHTSSFQRLPYIAVIVTVRSGRMGMVSGWLYLYRHIFEEKE